MRLHLPKGLLHAVLTALVTTSAALLGLGSTAYAGFDGNTFYLNGNNATDFNQNLSYLENTLDPVTGMWSNQYGTYQNGKYTLNTNPSGFTDTQLINTISTGERTFATIETLNVTDNKSLSIGAGGKGVFTGTGLVIEDFVIANSGTATLNVGNASECHKVTINSVTGTLNVVNYSNLTFEGSSESPIRITNLNLSGGTFTNGGTIEFQTGATVTLDRAFVFGDTVGDLPTSGNGFGTITDWSGDLSSYIKGTGILIGADAATWKLGTQDLTYSSGTDKLSAGSVQTATYIVQETATVSGTMSGAAYVQIYGTESSTTTLTLSSSLPNTVKAIVANEHTVFNIDGTANGNYELILNGGTLTNTGAEANVGKTKAQLCKMSVTADSVITADIDHSFGFVASQWGATNICLNGRTLTKNGTGEFFAASTTLYGGGTLKIESGKFTLGFNANGADKIGFLGREADSVNTNVWLTGGTLDGIFTVQRDAEIKADSGSGTVSAAITLNNGKIATLKAVGTTDVLTVNGTLSGAGKIQVGQGSGEVKLNGNNTYTGGTILDGGVVVAGHANALGTGALETTNKPTSSNVWLSTLQVSQEVTLSVTDIRVGTDATLKIQGDVNVTNGIDVSHTNQWKNHLTISSGITSVNGTVSICYASDVQISKDAALAVGGFKFIGNTESTSGQIVKSTTNTTTQIVLNSTDDFVTAKFENMDIAYSGTTDRTLKAELNNVALSTAAGAGKLTLAREGGVTLTGLTANSDVDFTSATTVTGTTSIADGVTVSSSADGSSLSTLSGSGSLKVDTGKTTVSNATGFTGTLEATGGTLTASGVSSLASMKATGAATLNARGVTESANGIGGLSLSELVIGAGSTVQAWGTGDTWTKDAEATVLMRGSENTPVTLTVGTAGQTGSSTLNANLVLDGATVTLNNALTMGSTLTLNNVNLINWDALVAANAGGGPIVLFTSVDSLTLGSGDSAFEAEAGTEYAASKAFSNTNMDNYRLQMVGSTGDYTVQMVKNTPTPEPTTATLSLLALMGLAARRRRKA